MCVRACVYIYIYILRLLYMCNDDINAFVETENCVWIIIAIAFNLNSNKSACKSCPRKETILSNASFSSLYSRIYNYVHLKSQVYFSRRCKSFRASFLIFKGAYIRRKKSNPAFYDAAFYTWDSELLLSPMTLGSQMYVYTSAHKSANTLY